MGSVSDNGTGMDVKATVIRWDAEGRRLKFWLLPFVPTPAEIAKLQANDPSVLQTKQSPDPKKWAKCPFVQFELLWDDNPSVGTAQKVHVLLDTDNLARPGSHVGGTVPASAAALTFTGSVKLGQDVALTSKGSHQTLGWDLKLRGKVLAAKSM
jgi:hypothetical protein